MSEPPYSWVCPACDRRVPARLDTCRCGFERDPTLIGPDPGAEPGQAASSSGQGRAGAVTRTLVTALAVVAIAAFAATRIFRPSTSSGRAEIVHARPRLPAQTEALTQPDTQPSAAADAVVPAPIATGPIAFPLAGPPATVSGESPALLEDVIGRAVPAVVSIETRDGRGSGFFVNPGVIITNNHVVGGHVSVTVRMSSGSTVPGRVERTSAETDLAIVRIDNPPAAQPTLPLGTAGAVRVGQEVIAIGLAMGQFQGTVTRGIISAMRRTGPGSSVLLLQTDAAINPGNSGGPLIDRHGRVVGIATLKVTGNAESLGFAVAADHARAFLAGANVQAPAAASSALSSPPLAPAFTSRSASDVMRDRGLQVFEQSLRTVSTRAAQIDTYWTEIKRECRGRVSGVYDREWFALWENRLTLASSDPGCLSAVDSLRQAADQIRTTMLSLHESARRASVYPGDIRQARSKLDLDWSGWDR